MAIDLFAEWRRGVAAGDLAMAEIVFKRFEPWIINAGSDAANLTVEGFTEFLRHLARANPDGLARGVRDHEKTLRAYYRWALERRFVSKLPFAPKANIVKVHRPPKLSTSEVLLLMQIATDIAENPKTRLISRAPAARTALAIGLIYHMGYSTAELSGLTLTALEDVCSLSPITAEVIRPAAKLYFDLLGPQRRSNTYVFVAPYSKRENILRQFTLEIKRLAIQSRIPAPARFNVEEIRKRHKEDFARERATNRMRLSTIEPKSIRLAGGWSAEEVVSLLLIHPRGSGLPSEYEKPRP